MKVYVFRNPDHKPPQMMWAELSNGWPIHTGDLQTRVAALFAMKRDFATLSDTVLSIIGWMIRTGKVQLPLSLVYVDASGTEYENQFCTDGELVMPWREEGFESIMEAGFHYRFSGYAERAS